MDLVFCGTPRFAVPTLQALVQEGFRVRLVVTQPDRPSGRGKAVTPSPVREAALALGLAISQPEKIKRNPEFQAQVESLAPRAIVVVGYGRLIPPWMLQLPPLGNINLHASLLPKYRGAAPIQWAIASGETVTGNTTMRIDQGLDTGAILLQEDTPIAPEDTAVTLGPRLAESGARLMVRTLRELEAGGIRPVPQDDSCATLAPILTKEDGRIDFRRRAREVCNRLRGFQPWPGAYSEFRGKNLSLHKAQPAGFTDIPPGELRVEQAQLFVGCGEETALEILELQLEGKKRMAAADFVHGYRVRPGEMLGG
jgi:methionyl-tRNA formyltransferase